MPSKTNKDELMHPPTQIMLLAPSMLLYSFLPPIHTPCNHPHTRLQLGVFGLDKVCHVLGPWVWVLVVPVVVVVPVAVLCRSNVVHLVRGSALHAARLGLLARERDPDDIVRISRASSAPHILLVARRVDHNRVLHGACVSSASMP